ncbi:MAG: AsmA-like C-terminal domain-containing protein [Deltaproteobacteria bacterium]|nr:AsmA-like C-terminal domain-containing protein [Deltaproteobacteria bacterium]
MKKASFIVAGGLLLLLVLLMLLVLAAPRLVNLGPVREAIQTTVSREMGGEVSCDRIILELFPRPRVILLETRLSIPDLARGSIRTATLYPRILPLLGGKFEPLKVQLESPELRLQFRPPSQEGKGKARSVSPEEAGKTPAVILTQIAAKLPDTLFRIENGSFLLSGPEQRSLNFKEIEATLRTGDRKLRVSIICTSNLWTQAIVTARINLKNFNGEGKAEVIGFRSQQLTSYLLPSGWQEIAEANVNLKFGFRIDGLEDIKVNMESPAVLVHFRQGTKEVTVKGKRLAATLHQQKNKTTVTLEKLELDYPRAKVSGRLVLQKESPRIALSLQGNEVDVSSAREVALFLGGNDSTTRDIFDVVRAGTIPLITCSARGDSLVDLQELDNIQIKGQMLDGEIFIPGAELDLKRVRGEALISHGVLTGKHLAAIEENARGWDGELRLGLEGEQWPLYLNIAMEANLGRLPLYLRRWIDNKAFLKELDMIKNLEGKAKGRLLLAGHTADFNTSVFVSGFTLAADYQRIPYSLSCSGGQFTYTDNGIEFDDLSVLMGNSTVSGLQGSISWNGRARLDVAFGRSEVVVEEIIPWLSKYQENLARALDGVEELGGILILSESKLQGPLLEPDQWSWKGSGSPKRIRIKAKQLPELLTLSGGKFKVYEDVKGQQLSLQGMQVNIMDTSLTISGSVYNYLSGLSKVDITLDGKVMPGMASWLYEKVQIPPAVRLRPPYSFSQSHLIWQPPSRFTFAGPLLFPEGPTVYINLLSDTGQLKLEKIKIEDGEATAFISFDDNPEKVVLDYKGYLTGDTVDKIVIANRFLKGWLKGGFQLQLPRDSGDSPVVQGQLEAEKVALQEEGGMPLMLEKASLTARGNQVEVSSTELLWGNARIDVSGNIRLFARQFVVDLELDADTLRWDQLKAFLQEEGGGNKTSGEKSSRVAFRGTLRLEAERFVFEKFTWVPLQAKIVFDQQQAQIELTRASLCGISTKGNLLWTPENLKVTLHPRAVDQDMNAFLLCVSGRERLATGTINLESELTASGKAEDLVGSMRGQFEFTARDGRIYHDKGLLGNLFDVLNVTEIFRGELPDLGKEGFAYSEMNIKGDIENGRLKLQEAILNGSSMELACMGEVDLVNKKLDLTVLVAPMKTVDFLIKKIPIVSQLLGGNLISIPMKVTGDWADPKVMPLSPSTVASGVLRLMERTLKLPVVLVQPLIPEKSEEKGEQTGQDEKLGPVMPDHN